MITVCVHPYCTRLTTGGKVCEYHLDLQRQNRRRHKESGRCLVCSNLADPGYTKCSYHRAKDKISSSKSYSLHREERREYERNYAEGRSVLKQYLKELQ